MAKSMETGQKQKHKMAKFYKICIGKSISIFCP